MMKQLLYILPLIFWGSCTPSVKVSEEFPKVDKERKAKILSAFFGLDNALPATAMRLSPKAPGKDGMPVVFSQEIDPNTLEISDFRIKTRDNEFHDLDDITFRPASEEFELRTVLLIGDYGDFPDNQPVEVEIIGDLLTRSGQNYKGQKIVVTPLEAGPFISYAEYFVFDENYPYVETGNGCDCPKDETVLVVRTVWSGGVRALDGKELGDKELKNFIITLTSQKDTFNVSPFKIADLRDNDNNIDLCLKEKGIPLSVSATANIAIDPRDDPNPITKCPVISRW